MKIAFTSENPFNGPVPQDYNDARTEFAWMIALNAEHYVIPHFKSIKDYDAVFVILPKCKTYLSAEGSQMVDNPEPDPRATLCNPNFINYLKRYNKKVYIIQEGPNWLFNDYNMEQQFNYYGCLNACDGIFVHNEIDKKFYKGITYGNKQVETIPTLMIEKTLEGLKSKKKDKTLIGGNFSRWYGGFQSFMVSNIFSNPVWTQTSHSKRPNEDGIKDENGKKLLNHFPRLVWQDWMTNVSTFKYAVHLMPTVAAGTFSLNCAYFGVPCIGNEKVDTQRICFPELSVDVDDVQKALEIAKKLKTDKDFYKSVSEYSIKAYKENYTIKVWKKYMKGVLNEKD